MFPRWVAIVFATILPACVGGNTRGVPLYSPQGPVREPSTVAMLLGDIETVDGKDVSSDGRTFEVLPGCHVVTTRRSFGRVEQGWPMSAAMPRLAFAIHIQANRSYVLEYEPVNNAGSGSTVTVNAREQDASGRAIATLLPTYDQDVLLRCLHETKKNAPG